jgi:acetyltransferase-like isoleucine patch superfamily enzyme
MTGDHRIPVRVAVGHYLVELVLAVLPHDPASSRVKASLMRWRGARVGERLKLWRDVYVDDYRRLTVGSDVSISKGAMFICAGGIELGDEVMVGYGAQLISAGHGMHGRMRFAEMEAAPIVVEDGAWIGAGAILLPGVTVGAGAVVAAGAVVTRDVGAGMLVGGVPAEVIKERRGRVDLG